VIVFREAQRLSLENSMPRFKKMIVLGRAIIRFRRDKLLGLIF